MKYPFKLSSLGVALAVMSLGVTFFVWTQHFEGSWGGFVLFIINFPASLLALLPLGLNQWVLFSVLGVVWWYVVGSCIERVLTKRSKRKH